MNILGSSIARGVFLVVPSGSALTRPAYGVRFDAAGTFTAVTQLGDAMSVTVSAGEVIPCVFTAITAAPAGTYGYKLS